MSTLQTPTRSQARIGVYSNSQDDGYFTPTSAHISRYARRPVSANGQVQVQVGIPFVLPSVKARATLHSDEVGVKSVNKNNNKQKITNLNRGGKGQETENDENQPHPLVDSREEHQQHSAPASPLRQSWTSTSTHAQKLPSPSVSKSTSRMGRRSITFPGTAVPSIGYELQREMNLEREEIGVGSPGRRKRINPDRSSSGSGLGSGSGSRPTQMSLETLTRSPLRAIGLNIRTSKDNTPTLLDPPGIPTPNRSPTPLQQQSRSIPTHIHNNANHAQVQPQPDVLSLAPPTPSGGLRRKSKFVARMSLKSGLGGEKGLIQGQDRTRTDAGINDEDFVGGGADTELDGEGDDEVDSVERGVVRIGSWVTEAFGDDEDVLVGASQGCSTAIGGSQREDPVGASQDVAAASQTTRKELTPPPAGPAGNSLRRSARLSAGRSSTSASPRPDHGNDPFEISNDSFVSAVSSSSKTKSKRVVINVQQDLPLPSSVKPVTPKPVARRRKRSSEVAAVIAGSVGITNESPNPRAKKNPRKSVLVVEIPTYSARMVGSPMRGVVRTSGNNRSSTDPVTPQRTAPVKRSVPVTDRPVGKDSRRSGKSGSDSPPASQGRSTGKGRKSLGAQFDSVQQGEDRKKTGPSKRRKGRKSLAPAHVVENLHAVMDHPLRPSSPSEDVLLLVGTEQSPTSHRRSRKSQSKTPRPGKDASQRKGKRPQSELTIEAGSSSQASRSDETGSRVHSGSVPPRDHIGHQDPRAERTLSPAPLHDDAPRSSSPDYPEFREYSPPNEENWQSLDFSGFGQGVCDSSPPARMASSSPPRQRIEPHLMDFTQATASTPLRTPLSKRRISTPHHKPIASSPPENVETDRTQSDPEPVWEDVEEGAHEGYASEGEFMANDRDSSPEYQDAEDKTAQDQDVADTVQADDDTTLPAADESGEEEEEAEGEEEEEEEEEEEDEEEEEQSREQVGESDTQAQEAPMSQSLANSEYVTIRTVVVKTEDNEAEPDPEDHESLTHEQETEEIASSAEVAMGREIIETVQVTQTLVVSPAEEPSATSKGQAYSQVEPILEDQGQEGDVSVEDAPRSQQSDSEGPHNEAPHTGAGRASPEARTEHDVDEDTEISLETARGTESMQTGIDNDYTRAPIVISSQDPRAAALAAAILRKSRRYIEAEAAPPLENTRQENKLKRRRSEYFVTAESAAALTPSELLREAEVELMDDESGYRRTKAYVEKTIIAQANDERMAGPSWNRDDWSVLNRCYRRVKRSHQEGKAREGLGGDEIDVDKVIDSFVFKKGITQEELKGERWARADLVTRINKLHRNAQLRSANSYTESLSSTERGSITAEKGPLSPIMKKTRTSEVTSRPTKVELRREKEASESSTGSGWWGSMSKTWKRIKSSISLASLAQEDDDDISSDRADDKEYAEAFRSREKPEEQDRRDRPMAPKPRRALPGGLSSLPIDTPMHPAASRGSGPGSISSPHWGRVPRANPNAVASTSYIGIVPPSEMKQVGDRSVTTSTRLPLEGSASQRSAAIKALFSSGASSPHFPAIPAHLVKNVNARPSPLSQSQTVKHSLNGRTSKQPIDIPRMDEETGTASPAVSELVESFEEAAKRSRMSAVSTEADVSLELGDQSGMRRVGSSDDFRRRSAMLEGSLSSRSKR